MKKEESEALLAFLFNHIGRGVDYQARVRWAPKTAVAWDVSIVTRDEFLEADEVQNRVTVHSATADWRTGERRHLVRITLKLKYHMRHHMSRSKSL